MVLNDSFSLDAPSVIEKSNSLGIRCRLFFYPLNRQPVLSRYGLPSNDCPEANRLASKIFYIPSGLALTDDEIARVIDAVQAVVG